MQEELSAEEQLQVLQSSGDPAMAAAVKAAFMDMQPVKRHMLLNGRCILEGLTRISRSWSGTVYQLKLTG